MKDDYSELTTLGIVQISIYSYTSSSSAYRKLVFLQKCDVSELYTNLTNERNAQQKNKKLLFQKRFQCVQEKNESFEAQNQLLKMEVNDWQGFLEKEHNAIQQINNEDIMKTEIKSPLQLRSKSFRIISLKIKTNPTITSPTNDRSNYFYKMKLGKYFFIQSTQASNYLLYLQF